MQSQYTDDGITNSQMLLVASASDIIEEKYGTATVPTPRDINEHKEDDPSSPLFSSEEDEVDEVQWIKTVENIIRDECPSGKLGLRIVILVKDMNHNETAVSEICKVVNNFNEILSDMTAHYVSDENLESLSSTGDVSELLKFRPGSTQKLGKKELLEWLKKNDELDLIYQQNANAYTFLSNLKKFQIYEQLFENNVKCLDTQYPSAEFNQMKNIYTIMKFAVNHAGGMGVFRHADIPWYTYSRNKTVRDYIKLLDDNISLSQPLRNNTQLETIEECSDQVFPEITGSASQEIVTQDFRCDLLKKDLDCLNGNNWILDSIITHYGDYLVENYKKKDIYIFQSTVIVQTMAKVIPKGHEYNYFAMPMHVHGSHWALVLIHMKQKKLFYLDSLPANSLHNFDQNPMNKKKAGSLSSKALGKRAKIQGVKETIRTRIIAIMKHNGYDMIQNFTWIDCIMPLQKGGYDCGVFVLRYLEDFFVHEAVLVVDWIYGKNLQNRYDDEEEMVKEYRERIRNVLDNQE